jgi:V/A-type H+-transporting ATPase subunit K
MRSKRKFVLSILMLQVILAATIILVIDSMIGIGRAQLPTPGYDTGTAIILSISAMAASVGSTLGAAMVIKTVGTAAISALTENEKSFFKSFLVIAMGETLAIYGLIVAILLWTKIPTP